MAELTSLERRLVEEWTSTLDYVSRVAQGLEHGDWFYMMDKARELAYTAGKLQEVAADIWKDVDEATGEGMPRRELVMAEIHRLAGYYRAGRGLYGLDKPPSPFDDLD